jgi:hypothetical protein
MYTYNDGPDPGDDYFDDPAFGINPPAIFVTQLQGPPLYIPGLTYQDNNGDKIFSPKYDTPIDTAFYFRGQYMNSEIIPGALNSGITSSIHYMEAHPTQGDPDNEMQMRNYLKGASQRGRYIDPCNWEFGDIFGEDCSAINPRFMYSGDPVERTGWVNTFPTDQRQMMASGPFFLEKGKPVELIYAYVIRRGTDALNSITVTRDNVADVINFYESNFTDTPVNISQKEESDTPAKFRLSQNYPNPFNPSTMIEYSLPVGSQQLPVGSAQNRVSGIPYQESSIENQSSNHSIIQSIELVQLKVYDVLGREVATLVDKPQSPGNYKVQWNAGNLASGVYFYRLSYGKFNKTRKMLLLR